MPASKVPSWKEPSSKRCSSLLRFLSKRGFLIPLWVEKIVGKQLVFSLNTGWAKFYQNDQGETVAAREEDF